MSNKVHTTFNDRGEKLRFMAQPNQLVAGSYVIFEYSEAHKSYDPIGDYTVLDKSEPIDITEKKLENMMKILNEKQTLVDFKNLTKERILFNVVQEDESGTKAGTKHKVIFRSYDGNGVSKENAVLTIEKGVFDDA